MTKVNDKFPALEARNIDARTRRYLIPKRVVYTQGTVRCIENILREKSNQIAFIPESEKLHCFLENKEGQPHAAILLDFGIEFAGSLRIMINKGSTPSRRSTFLIRFGESVSEAMTPVGTKNATNDHANREQILNVGRLSSNETNESGYRFAYIELLDENCTASIKAIQGVFHYRDWDYKGSFECSDEKLNRIWDVAAYTVHLCAQDNIWDGIKRDRLVWIGDMHPEVKTLLTVFGNQKVIADSLDIIRDDTPDDEWMNGMCSYSMWWIIIHHELFRATGDMAYLAEQKDYLVKLMNKVSEFADENGVEQVPPRRFLDWPNENNLEAIHAGLQGLTKMALDCGASLLRALGEDSLAEKCEATAERMKNYIPDCNGSKQAAALLALSGIGDPVKLNKEVLAPGGAHGYSTYFGYYLLAAKALAGDYAGALDDIKAYWGGMLDMGATTFWEDFDIDWMENASRIDEIVPEGKVDIHAAYGAFCYMNLRHSLCHGWASGPCPYLTNYVLGIRPLSADTYEVKPELAYLEFAKGTYPTPYGIITVNAKKEKDGSTSVEISAPEGIKIVR